MDWNAFAISVQLGMWTLAMLLPLALGLARTLAVRQFPAKRAVEGLVALPLVLPPTVLGFYLLRAFSVRSPFGELFEALGVEPLAFSFRGLVLASTLVNLPFAVQPMQRAFENIPTAVREAAACCGMSSWRAFMAVELPLAWPGVLTAIVLVFAHTLGEFGVVLMVGGNIPGETRTLSIAIYDRLQAFDDRGAGIMAATLLGLAIAALVLTSMLGRGSRAGRG